MSALVVLLVVAVAAVVVAAGALWWSQLAVAVMLWRWQPLRQRRSGVRLVVSRFAEDLGWLESVQPYASYETVTIYNKGKPLSHDYGAHVVDLPNVGRCDHTALRHIIDNYENLDDVTVFLPGSVNEVAIKRVTATYLLTRADVATRSQFYSLTPLLPWQTILSTSANYEKGEHYVGQSKTNLRENADTRLQPAWPRRFEDWMLYHLPGRDSHRSSHMFVFSVTREAVLSNPKSFYERLIKLLEVGPNPAAGHFFERAWPAIFNVTR